MSVNLGTIAGVAINLTGGGLLGEALGIYEERVLATAQANAWKSAQALGKSFGYARGGQWLQNVPRTITLELTFADTTPSITITFSVGVQTDGYAQTIDITSTARQNVHQTVIGNYVDEWGMGIGQLSIDCDVAWVGGNDTGAQIQKFFDLLQQAKQNSPLLTTSPAILRYHDSYLSRSYVIAQDALHLTEVVDRPNQGHLTLTAQILKDYALGNFPNTATTSVANNPTPATPDIVADALTSGLQVLTA